MEKKRILVVDDEEDLCEILLYNLISAGYEAAAAHSAEESLYMMDETSYDLLLLDVMMPGMSGFELARQLKRQESTAHIPIIFLTAKDTEEDMLYGFGIGADDYVKKPFSVREVLARVNAVLSRAASTPVVVEGSRVSYEGLVVHFDSKQVMVDGEEVALTKTEFELLSLLLSHQGQVFSRQEFIDLVWPKDVIVTDRAVDVNITRMRKKIGNYSRHVVTRQGFGYCFSPVVDNK